MGDDDRALFPDSAERAVREADLEKERLEILADIKRRRKRNIIISVLVLIGAGLIWLGIKLLK